MAIYYGDGGNSSSGRVVQVAYSNATGEDGGNETSWTNTGLCDMQFNITSGNKVLLWLQLGMGEQYDGSWAVHGAYTVYCTSQGILGDSTWGITGGWVSGANGANNDMQYGFQRMSGMLLYTPNTTTPRYRIYRKRPSGHGFQMTTGSAYSGSSEYNSGSTQLIAMEITA